MASASSELICSFVFLLILALFCAGVMVQERRDAMRSLTFAFVGSFFTGGAVYTGLCIFYGTP